MVPGRPVVLLCILTFLCAETSKVVKREIPVMNIPTMELTFYCPPTVGDYAKATFITDGQVIVTAFCKNGNFTFNKVSLIELSLDMTVKAQTPGVCEMWLYGDGYPDPAMRSKIGSTYMVEVRYEIGPPEHAIYFADNRENLICNYDYLGTGSQNISKVEEPKKSKKSRPKDKPKYKGKKIPDVITMDVVDIDDIPISGRVITISTVMRIKAIIHNPGKMIRAVSCTAINHVGIKHKMLSNGCGQGIVLGIDEGFINYGNVTYSPFFRVFRLAGSYSVGFQCVFVACLPKDCFHKNSCPTGVGLEEPLVVPF